MSAAERSPWQRFLLSGWSLRVGIALAVIGVLVAGYVVLAYQMLEARMRSDVLMSVMYGRDIRQAWSEVIVIAAASVLVGVGGGIGLLTARSLAMQAARPPPPSQPIRMADRGERAEPARSASPLAPAQDRSGRYLPAVVVLVLAGIIAMFAVGTDALDLGTLIHDPVDDVPVPAPDQIRQDLVGQKFTYEHHPMEGWRAWTIFPTAIKEFSVVSAQTNSKTRRHSVVVRLRVEPDRPVEVRGWTLRYVRGLQGTVTVEYMLEGDPKMGNARWRLDHVRAGPEQWAKDGFTMQAY